MATTRKNAAKSTKAVPRKKGGKATAAPPPDSDTTAPVDPAAVAVAALQNQIVERDSALESQERRITQVAAMRAEGNAATNSRAEIASGSNVHLDEANEDEDDHEETDTPVNSCAGLAPRTNSSVPSGFSRQANQFASATARARASTAALPLMPVLTPALAPISTIVPPSAPSTPEPAAPAIAAGGSAPTAPVAAPTNPGASVVMPVAPVAAHATAVVPAAPVAPPAAPTVPTGTRIPHPGGRVNHGCDLCVAMRLTQHTDLYKEIHRKVLWMFTYANLPLNVYWKHQDPHKLLAISTAVIKAFPYLNNFQPPSWPVTEMLKIMLRNKRAYRKRTVPTTAEGLPINDLDGGLGGVGGA
ncbi:hypothetical protein RSOL_305520 [Rhizoctonia solani AG-3 Rhs1AP]|uniref:Uncharacterized protein n=2 Tax=Rhizoctonia solani AG-3 TaxID=1086053 RepID=A0A074RJY6_9AGAM|nr:hypothetical protein RSOL_305520 [Rhizoctonia solani AG-3 Rhs1AP]KEP45675.1 hypothetical protein V565_250660 [Rhizoctonia solani 123E]